MCTRFLRAAAAYAEHEGSDYNIWTDIFIKMTLFYGEKTFHEDVEIPLKIHQDLPALKKL